MLDRKRFFVGKDCAASLNNSELHFTVFRSPTWEHFAYKSCRLIANIKLDTIESNAPPGAIVVELGRAPAGTFRVVDRSSYAPLGTLELAKGGGTLNLNSSALARAKPSGDRSDTAELADAERRTFMSLGEKIWMREAGIGTYVKAYTDHNLTSPLGAGIGEGEK